jgi:hypothetical protein
LSDCEPWLALRLRPSGLPAEPSLRWCGELLSDCERLLGLRWRLSAPQGGRWRPR